MTKWSTEYIKREEVLSLNLPLRYLEVREDGYFFQQYYYRTNTNTGIKKLCEFWVSPKALQKKDERRAISKKKTSIEKINKAMIDASKTKSLKKILTVNELPLVSIDFNHNPSSSIFDLTQTQVLNNKFCRILSWYDNEWGFSNRMIDTLLNFRKLL